jgi:hypothetical protein
MIVASLVLIMNADMANGAYQSSTNYIIHTDVLSGGGGDMASDHYGLSSTLGQSTPIGISSGTGSQKVYAGFWFPAIYYTPTAVFLSSFRAYAAGGQVVVEWETASEIGTVGFYLLRLDEKTGKYRKVNTQFLPGLLIAPQGGVYRLVDEKASSDGTYTYKLVEIEAKGRENTYGPFTVTVGDEGIFAAADTSAQPDTQVPVSGYDKKAHKMSAAKKARLDSRILAVEAAAATELVTSDTVKIAVKQSSLYYVDASDIGDVMGQTFDTVKNWIKQKSLILNNLGLDVAWLPAEDNDGIYFYGEAIDSIYTNQNIYTLTNGKKGNGLTMDMVGVAGPSPANGNETFIETIHVEEDHFALTGLFDDPKADYWLWDYLIAGNSGKTFNISANGVSASEAAILKVHLQGVTDTEVSPDHHVQITLNGTSIGDGNWDGASAYELICEFDPGILYEGDNVVEVTGLLDTGAPYSIFYIDSFDLTYQRYYQAVDDKIFVRGDGNPVITIEGFSNPDIFVFELSDPKKPKLVQATTIDGGDGNYRVSFLPSSPETNYLALTFDASGTPASVTPDIPSNLKQKKNTADYIVITPSELKTAATRLADYRQGQGIDTKVVELQDIYDEFNHGISSPEAIRDFLLYAYQNWRKAPRYVVLAGEGTYDYKDNQGYGDNLLPVLMKATPYGMFASDNQFVDVEGNDGLPEMAIGRLPVVTSTELDLFTGKIRAYETAGGDWKSRVLMLADDPDDGGNFPADSNGVADIVTPEYTAEKIYLSEHSISEARQLLQDGINNGAFLLNYIGHASLDRLSAEGMLMDSDMDFLDNGDKLPVMTAMTCVAGRFAIPGIDSLGELLVLRQGGGAIAAWAPTGLSLNELALILDKEFFCAVFEDEEKILGEMVLRALEDYAWAGKPRFMLDIYNLMGDPALQMW